MEISKSPREWLKHPMGKFILKAGLIYLVWEFFNSYMQGYAWFDRWWDQNILGFFLQGILNASEFTLRLLPYEVYREGIVLKLDGSPGVAVGPGCVGLGLMFAMAALIISYQGPWKKKLWFIPLGVSGIFAINVCRIVVLALISKYNHHWVDFNHKYVFNTLVYCFIFFMWVMWVRHLEEPSRKAI